MAFPPRQPPPIRFANAAWNSQLKKFAGRPFRLQIIIVCWCTIKSRQFSSCVRYDVTVFEAQQGSALNLFIERILESNFFAMSILQSFSHVFVIVKLSRTMDLAPIRGERGGTRVCLSAQNPAQRIYAAMMG
jgi:hypothetical protein